MRIEEKQVLKALSTVEDPDLKKDLVTLNMIQDLKIEDNKIGFTLELTTPACPLKEMLKNNCKEAIHNEFGSDVEIAINVTSQVTTTRDKASFLPNVKNIIAVASGKGGVGKSTVASNIAVALAKMGAKVGLIDADIYGPSVPVMFNCENERPAMTKKNGKDMIIPLENYGVKILSIGFLTPSESAVVWRGPMASSALKQFMSDAEWGELDYMIIDLPPGTSDIHLTLVQTVSVTGAIVVTTPQKVALSDAVKGISMFRQPQINVPVLGIVENMAYFTPDELPENKYYIFGEGGGKNLSEKYDVPLIGQVPIVQSIRESGDSGYPAVLKEGITADAFNSVAENLVRQVAIRNASMGKTKKVEINT